MKTQTRWRVLVVVALAVVSAGQRWGSLATTARADTGLAITADQPLIPAFNRSVHDYAVRCSGAPDVVSVNARTATGGRTHSVNLTVTTDAGLSDTIVRNVRVLNRAPSASMSFTGGRLHVDRSISFRAVAHDPDGRVEIRRWSFGDGRVAYGIRAQHTYRRAGRYTVTLRVTDDRGATTTRRTTIRVTR